MPWLPLAIALLVVLALARLAELDRLVVWHDEVFTLVRVFGHSQDQISNAIFNARLLSPATLLSFQEPHPELGWGDAWYAFAGHPEHAPLYYVLVRVAAGLTTSFDISPVSAARGISALAGIALILAAFWLARELFGRGPVAWIAALLVAASPMELLYAQEARQYSLWTLLVALSSATLIHALNHPERRAAWWLYTVLLTLGLYSHLLFVLMIPVHGIYLLLARERQQWPAVLRRWGIGTAIAIAAFSPWILVILTHHEAAANYTAWMARPIGVLRNLNEWSGHLIRLFVDLGPGAPVAPWTTAASLLLFALLVFLVKAPRPAIWLPIGITLAYVGVVLGPDLLFDGSRSQHVRYALPAMLAIQLIVAWVIATGLSDDSFVNNWITGIAFAAILLLGGLSMLRILEADTWWNKQFSASNAEVARTINSWERPLVVAGASGVATGELISLAYHLDPNVRIWGEYDDAVPPVEKFSDVMALLPSPALAESLEAHGKLAAVDGTWQWHRLVRADNQGRGDLHPATDPSGGARP